MKAHKNGMLRISIVNLSSYQLIRVLRHNIFILKRSSAEKIPRNPAERMLFSTLSLQVGKGGLNSEHDNVLHDLHVTVVAACL